MSRTPLLRSLRQLVRDARASRTSGIPVDEIQDIRTERRLSRRGFLAGAAAGATALALPRVARASGPQPSVTIVGGGIAGLTCALTLADAGYTSTVYEAAGRVGGRMFTNTTSYFGGQVTEWGGELVDSGHKTVRRLANRFNLPLDNLLNAQPANSRDIYRFDGRYYAATAADADFFAMAGALDDDLEAADFPTTFDAFTPAGRALDKMTVRQWINSRVPGGYASKLGQVLDTAYAIEYGADTTQQSALNLIYLLGYQPTGAQMDIFGESDEKFHIRGGNQQLPTAIAARLGASVRTGYSLVRLAETAHGRYRLTFERGNSTTEVVSDYVVLALPFAVLRDIDTSGAGFDARKRRAINQLGRGHNGKLQLQFAQRAWIGTGAWPGKANGSSYSDSGYQASWDATRAQSGTAGILVLYSGGSVTDAMKTTSPFATAADAKVQLDAERGYAQIRQTFPAVSWNGKATQSLPHKSPFFNASYSFYKPGQYTDFGGHEGARQNNVYFCGEHTSLEFQGFMEGGAITGQDVAQKLIKKLR
ncbi:MAG: FAD-dependent oxidoreductase [Deltaproteobacteria bacterium]|nr:FAD-dependent oxidoreductase [Deltaproteobacteria bacterium]